MCPPKLRSGLFTTSAVDNIDHNPSSTTAQGSFHGTGISLFQHPSIDFGGHNQECLVLNPNDISRKRTISQLPDAYTGIPPVILQEKEPAVPEVSGLFTSSCENFTSAMQDQYMWLDHAKEVYDAGDVESEQDMKVSWSAYHASSMVTNTDSPVDITALLALFQDEAKSPSMIKHALNVVKQAVEFLNLNQVPVVACDQPLYATAKLVQWNYPKTHGEEKVFDNVWRIACRDGSNKDTGRLAAR